MENPCENCKYFVQHYAKHGINISNVSCGHCTNRKLTKIQKKKRLQAKHCEHWESNETEKETQHESLEAALRQIAEQLSAIAALLGKND